MKHIIILLLLVFTINAQEQKQKVTIGIGPYFQTQPYRDVDNFILASPVIFFDNSLIYIRWSRGGIYFLGGKEDNYAWGFSLTAQPRVYGYNASAIEGMSERKNTWEGGLAFSAKIDKIYIEIMALTDILDKYDSFIVKTEIGYDLEFANLSLYPSLIFIYQSSDFLNYYYGVREDEKSATREKYIPNNGLQIGLQSYLKYPLTDNLSTLLNFRIDRLSKEATHSPIVEDNFIYSGLVSIIYTFET